MVLRLAVLALLACAMARPPSPTLPRHTDSAEHMYDPFDDWDDYHSSEDASRIYQSQPTPHTTRKVNAKVTMSAKRPKLNVTVTNVKSKDKKNVVKTTNINIESYSEVVVSENPVTAVKPLRTSTVKAVRATSRRPGSTRAPSSKRPPSSTRPPAVRRPPSTTKRKPGVRNPTTSKPKPKTTTKKPCKTSDNKNGWYIPFFQKKKDTHKVTVYPKPSSSGFLSQLYSWLGWDSEDNEETLQDEGESWFSGFFTSPLKVQSSTVATTIRTTTTTNPPTTTEKDWFYSLLSSEDDDGAYVNNITKSPKKAIKKTYNGYQLLRTYPDVAWKVHELLELQEETQGSGLMWWTPPTINGSTDILVPRDLLADVKDQIKSMGMEYDVIIWDVQKAIQYENPKMSKKQRTELEQLRGHPLTWRRYHRYADILRYLEYLQHSYSDYVELVPLGRSSEGLPLVAVKVSHPSNESFVHAKPYTRIGNLNKKKKWQLRSRMKPAIWVEGGAHAREWISPAVVTWILHTLIEGERGLGGELEMLKAADWFFLPVLNPDGYEHSHTHDRLWRKTRSRYSLEDDYYNSWFPWNWGRTECIGVDADRNWDFHWGEKGASKDPCSDYYAGPHPFSEPETRAVSNFIAENKERIKAYISLHAYSQAWLVPSTHARVPFADDGEVMEMGKLAVAALADVYGTKYQVGTAAELQQPVSGSAHDWAKARATIKYSYHVNLRDSFGPYGFLLPGAQIVPTAKETWHAIKAIADNL